MSVRNRIATFTRVIAALAFICGIAGCIPPMANMQGPEIAPKSSGRFTPHYSAITNPDREDDVPTDAIGLLLGSPIGDGAELQVRVDYFRPRDDDPDENAIVFLGVGPKFRLFSEHLALVVPGGFYVTSESVAFETFQLMPGLIAGFHLHPRIEPIGAVRFVLPIESDAEQYMIANAGLRLSPISPKWAIIPEASFAWALGPETDTRLAALAFGFAWLP